LTAAKTPPVLEVSELAVSYNPRSEGPVLKGVNMTLKGEKAAIVGPNGSGKSTLFRAALGLVKFQSGSVKVFGRDVSEERGDVGVSTNLAEVYRLAYVPGRDIVDIFAELKGGPPESALKLFQDFELTQALGKRIHEMSTGQQKMFGNLLAVSFSPKLVFLDEPFDNVDENRRRKFVELLKGLDAEVVIITHEFNLLQRLPDWGLYFMLEGRLWGKFNASQLDRLYITRGVAEDALEVMDTSLGKLSVTLDHGDVAVKTASNVSALLEQV
jgi:ABC-type multidrug transport system ATPase subunit